MYLKIWNNQCHSTGVKKSYLGHAFHLTPKKSFLVGGGGGLWVKSDFSVVCDHFFKDQRSKWTQSLTITQETHFVPTIGVKCRHMP